MNVLLLQLDGKLPNIALMRIAAHHKANGDSVSLLRTKLFTPDLFEHPDKIYASLIFEKSKPAAETLLDNFPDAIVGGTGWNVEGKVEDHGITTLDQDYSLYPDYQNSIGFSQRGCRLKCSFCVVPKKEGKARKEKSIHELWRGDPYPKNLCILDNDFFGQPGWEDQMHQIHEGKYKVSFCQGINARFLNDESAKAIASIPYYDYKFTRRCIYTAWDNRKDEARLMRGLNALKNAGVNPGHIMVYILIGYWPGETQEDWEYRRRKLREFGCDPYPMPYVRNKVTVGFQRWVCGHYDKRVPWSDWVNADYRPRKLASNPNLGLTRY